MANKGNKQKKKSDQINRGDIVLVDFNPTIGHEIRKTRPALVVQNDLGNKYSPIIIVAAITSTIPYVPNPVKVNILPNQINGLSNPSAICLNQIRSIDHKRVRKYIGRVDNLTLIKVGQALRISLGLIEI